MASEDPGRRDMAKKPGDQQTQIIMDGLKEMTAALVDTQRMSIESQERLAMERMRAEEALAKDRMGKAHTEATQTQQENARRSKYEHCRALIVLLGAFALGGSGTAAAFWLNKPEIAVGVLLSTLTGIFGWLAGGAHRKADKSTDA